MKTGKLIKWLKHSLVMNSDNANATIRLLKRGEKTEKGLIQFLEKENPYPEDVFLIIKKEDLNKINNFFKKELGYPMDRLSGNMGRRIYKSITEILREIIK